MSRKARIDAPGALQDVERVRQLITETIPARVAEDTAYKWERG